MPLPHSKQELADWILRRLGAPVVNIEIADVQLEDVIDEAVQFFQEYHYDGAERAYRVIKVEGDVLNGNARRHQELTAPMYDIALQDTYRIGDRVMTYKQNGTPDMIWVKYDSEERILKSFFSLDDNGDWFIRDSDQLLIDLEIVADSDSYYVSYDSESHNVTVYFIAQIGTRFNQLISGTIPIEGQPYYVDSDNDKVLYDSDRHVLDVYFVDPAGAFVDSDGIKVAYDSDKHVTDGYELVVDSDLVDVFYVDLNGTFVPYDSDRDGVVYSYVSDPVGLYVREEGTDRYVLASIDPAYATSPKFSQLINRPTLYSQVDVQPTRYSVQKGFPTLYQLADQDFPIFLEYFRFYP